MRYPILENSFLGNKIRKEEAYTIIGAGISGLFCGFYLKKAGIKFRIVEQANHAGGLLGTKILNYGIAEKAANGFLWCKELAEICDTLKLEILPPRTDAKARYLVRNKQLRKFPLNPIEAVGVAGRIMTAHPAEVETIADFGQQYLGNAMTNQILEPAIAGIYGCKITELSFPGALTMLAKILNQSNWLPSAIWKNRSQKNNDQKNNKIAKGTFGFKGGMQVLVNGLTNYLQDDIEYNFDGTLLADSADHCIVTTPAYVSSTFFDGELKKMLSGIEYIPMITTTLIFKKSQFEKLKPGFGCLIPRSEGLNTLGVLFNSYIFDHRVVMDDMISLTCMMGDESENGDVISASDQDIITILLKDLNVLFKLTDEPLDFHVFRWPKAIPKYTPQLYKSWFRMDEILKQQFPNRNLFGNYTGEISIRGMSTMASKIVD